MTIASLCVAYLLKRDYTIDVYRPSSFQHSTFPIRRARCAFAFLTLLIHFCPLLPSHAFQVVQVNQGNYDVLLILRIRDDQVIFVL